MPSEPKRIQPTPGALRAAETILEMRGVARKTRRIIAPKYAEIIDREGILELLEALEGLCNAVDGGVYRPPQSDWDRAEAAIKKARG